MAKVELDLIVDSKQATKSLKTFQKNSKKTSESAQKSFNALKLAIGGAAAFLAGRQLVRGMSAITEAAKVQEDAVNALNTALKISGEFSEEASVGLQKFASALQQQTKFGDEVILQNAALIQSLGGLTDDALKEATAAAVDLSAALGVDLSAAATLVGKAAVGEIGSFSRYGVVIKKGADNAETFANTLTELNKKFGGAAAAQVNTFSGATQQLSNTFGDLQEELGFVITKNPAVIEAVKGLTSIFQDLIQLVVDNQKSLSEGLASGIQAMINAIPAAIRFVGSLAEGLGFFTKVALLATAGLVNLTRIFVKFGAGPILSAFANGFRAIGAAVLTAVDAVLLLAKFIPGASKALGVVGVDLDETQKQVALFRDGLVANIGDPINTKGIEKSLEGIEEKTFEITDSVEKTTNSVTSGIKAVADTAAKSIENLNQKIATRGTISVEAKAEEDSSFIDTVVEGFNIAAKAAGELLNKIPFDGIAKGLAVASDILIGAFTVASGLFSGDYIAQFQAVLEQFTNPEKLLQVVDKFGEFVEKLLDPDTIAGLFDKAIDSIDRTLNKLFDKLPAILNKLISDVLPKLFRNIVQSIPKLIKIISDALVDLIKQLPNLIDILLDALPSIITALLDAVPDIVLALVDAIPAIVESFAENIGPIIDALVTGLADGSSEIINGLVESLLFEGGLERIIGGLLRAIPRIWESLARGFVEVVSKAWGTLFDIEIAKPAWIQELQDTFANFDPFGGGNSSGDTARKILDPVGVGTALGFAEGGTVPDGFPNDTFPARLSSGETVVPKDDVDNIRQLAQNQSDTRDILVQMLALMGGGGQTVNANIVLDNEVLASAILNLNRNNARLA